MDGDATIQNPTQPLYPQAILPSIWRCCPPSLGTALNVFQLQRFTYGLGYARSHARPRHSDRKRQLEGATGVVRHLGGKVGAFWVDGATRESWADVPRCTQSASVSLAMEWGNGGSRG